MSADVWVGALISVPVSIGCALLVPYIQRWLEKRGERSHQKQRDRLKDEYSTVLHYAMHTDLLLGRMLVTLISLALILILILALRAADAVFRDSFAVAFDHPSLPQFLFDHRHYLVLGALSLYVTFLTVWLVSIVKMSWEYVSIFYNVKGLSSYLDSVPSDIRDKELEKYVICAVRERAMPLSTYQRYRLENPEPGKQQETAIDANPQLEQPGGFASQPEQ